MPRPTVSAASQREHRESDSIIGEFTETVDSGHLRAELLLNALMALRRHIHLEEVLLLPAIPDGRMVMAIGVMLREHGQPWQTMGLLMNLLADGNNTRRLADTCGGLLEQLQQHNSKEEPVIYAQADKDLAPETIAELARFVESGRTPDGWECGLARV